MYIVVHCRSGWFSDLWYSRDVPNKQRFKGKLSEQLRWLRNSCENYDRGDKSEAIRIATILRVLMHDTFDRRGRPNSMSLLTHLKAKDRIKLYSTINPPPDAIEYHGMGRVFVNISEDLNVVSRRIEPVLDFEAGPPVPVSVPDWWQMPVYVSRADAGVRIAGSLAATTGQNFCIARKDIVLGAADKEGGAHVDETPASDYERPASLGVLRMYEGEIELANGRVVPLPPLADAPFVFLRQMGYEVLESPDVRGL